MRNPATNTKARYVRIVPVGVILLSVNIATGADTKTQTKQLNNPTIANLAYLSEINVIMIPPSFDTSFIALYRCVSNSSWLKDSTSRQRFTII